MLYVLIGILLPTFLNAMNEQSIQESEWLQKRLEFQQAYTRLDIATMFKYCSEHAQAIKTDIVSLPAEEYKLVLETIKNIKDKKSKWLYPPLYTIATLTAAAGCGVALSATTCREEHCTIKYGLASAGSFFISLLACIPTVYKEMQSYKLKQKLITALESMRLTPDIELTTGSQNNGRTTQS